MDNQGAKVISLMNITEFLNYVCKLQSESKKTRIEKDEKWNKVKMAKNKK